LLQEFNHEVQEIFLRLMVTNPELYTRTLNIYNPENFDKKFRAAARLIREHADKYRALPSSLQIKATCGVSIDPVEDYQDADGQWFLDNFEAFTKRQELERAILESAKLLEKGEFGTVETLIKKAVQISLQKDMGTDYFADPRARLLALKSTNAQLSTGWVVLDDLLNGGFNRGELQLFTGGSGAGKSLFMQNLAVNYVTTGYNVIYITLELNEGLCAARIDSMMADVGSKELYQRLDDVVSRVAEIGKTAGSFQLKYVPAQSTINDIRAYCKEWQIQSKKKIDVICLDYLDLLMPYGAKVSASDLFVKDKYVAEEARNLAKELNVIMITASQLNRSAVEETEFDHSHISGGISKIMTADNMFGIFTSRSMKERGKYQLQMMKTRSSDGVGKKCDLLYNNKTLRILSPASDKFGSGGSGSLIDQMVGKIRNGEVQGDSGEITEVPKVKGDIQSAKLKQMLAARKTT